MKKSRQILSEQGQQRKRSTLAQLQRDVKSLHAKRQKRAITAATSLLAIFIAAVAFQFYNSDRGNDLTTMLEAAKPSATKANVRTFSFATVEKNRDSISNRYIDSRSDSKLEFEPLSDDELTSALKSNGGDLVLAEIDGQKRLIPAKL